MTAQIRDSSWRAFVQILPEVCCASSKGNAREIECWHVWRRCHAQCFSLLCVCRHLVKVVTAENAANDGNRGKKRGLPHCMDNPIVKMLGQRKAPLAASANSAPKTGLPQMTRKSVLIPFLSRNQLNWGENLLFFPFVHYIMLDRGYENIVVPTSLSRYRMSQPAAHHSVQERQVRVRCTTTCDNCVACRGRPWTRADVRRRIPWWCWYLSCREARRRRRPSQSRWTWCPRSWNSTRSFGSRSCSWASSNRNGFQFSGEDAQLRADHLMSEAGEQKKRQFFQNIRTLRKNEFNSIHWWEHCVRHWSARWVKNHHKQPVRTWWSGHWPDTSFPETGIKTLSITYILFSGVYIEFSVMSAPIL